MICRRPHVDDLMLGNVHELPAAVEHVHHPKQIRVRGGVRHLSAVDKCALVVRLYAFTGGELIVRADNCAGLDQV